MRCNNYSISLDWLSFSVTLLPTHAETINQQFEMRPPAGYRIDLLPGNNIYKQRAIVRTRKGQRVLTLLFQPYSKILNPLLCLVEVDNAQLYSNDWHDAVALMQACHDCTINNLSRVDICCDFEMHEHEIATLSAIEDNSVYIKRYKSKTVFAEQTADGKIYYDAYCINWGSKTSAIKFKAYNKVKEITTDTPRGQEVSKPYIVDRWQDDGLDISQPIWRLEVSISYAAGLQDKAAAKSISWEDLTDDNIVNLFSSLYHSRFIQRKNQGHIKRQNDERIELLKLPYTDIELQAKPSQSHDEDYSLVGTLRKLMAQMDVPEVRYNRQMLDVIQQAIYSTVELGDLDNYIFQTYGRPLDQLFQKANEDCAADTVDLTGSLSINQYIS